MPVDRHSRSMLPIPDRPPAGLTTYDAKDPDTRYPRSSHSLRLRVPRTCW